ncbi:uncharacterized protein ASCRUDRAFT_76992 [Ascoidea rubescens DSM 1968]|uniref:F-box domain-containing protein n=1 Tax=Ascoidea rubescens DSM 1968 TaxID=1344418 RepID=A0A1D2VDC5_9ASCO|nr:hypothetical protein ASCRUDRAFT_76992 [Ascoidea rubescens DSM 1968]ODV59641.1 hypothetical protein ASCRUDRAFT_76992 [Ascoidea rubescens DSM 1968]
MSFPINLLPIELQFKIICKSDIKTCVNLLKTNKKLRCLTLLALNFKVSKILGVDLLKQEYNGDESLNKLNLSLFSPQNKRSSSDKYYYELLPVFANRGDNDINEEDIINIGKRFEHFSVKLNKCLLSKNLLSKEVKKVDENKQNLQNLALEDNRDNSNDNQNDSQNDNQNDNQNEKDFSMNLLINEYSSFFKFFYTLSVTKDNKSNDTTIKRNKLAENSSSIKLNKMKSTVSNNSLINKGIKLDLNVTNLDKVEPPKHDYDFDVFENFKLDIINLQINTCFLLDLIESGN